MDEVAWRTLTKGRCFVYLLACRDEDTQKIGFARDPWVRLREFHPRFHAFFDLNRGALIEVDRVAEARKIERQLINDFTMQASSAPLVVRERAGGKFEWFRGIHAQSMVAMQAKALALGYPFHESLGNWLHDQWMGRVEVIIAWSRQTYASVEMLQFNAHSDIARLHEQRFRSTLDCWLEMGVPLEELLDRAILDWYRWGFTS